MSAGVYREHDEFVLVFLPNHHPVRFQVAFEAALVFACEFVRLVFRRELSFFRKDLQCVFDYFHVIASFAAYDKSPVEFP